MEHWLDFFLSLFYWSVGGQHWLFHGVQLEAGLQIWKSLWKVKWPCCNFYLNATLLLAHAIIIRSLSGLWGWSGLWWFVRLISYLFFQKSKEAYMKVFLHVIPTKTILWDKLGWKGELIQVSQWVSMTDNDLECGIFQSWSNRLIISPQCFS